MAKKSKNEKKDGRVIVTYGRSLIALMIAQSLGSRNIDVIGCDDVDLTVLYFSKFVSKNLTLASFKKNPDQFIDDLEHTIKENKPEDDRPYVLIPSFIDAKMIAKYKHRFDDYITIACPDYETIEKVHPKDKLTQTAHELSLDIPETRLCRSEDEVAQAAADLTFPLLIKPPDASGGRGISKHSTEGSVINAFKELQHTYKSGVFLVQETASGQDYCFCGIYDNGRRLASMVYENTRKYPRESGPGVVRKSHAPGPLDALSDKLLEPLKWSGVIEIDYMWDGNPDTKPKMIEVNPRFWMGLDHSIKSNLDFPYMLYQLFTEQDVDTSADLIKGKKTSLPGLSTLAGLEDVFTKMINFDKLEEQWPDIKHKFEHNHFGQAFDMLTDSLSGSVSMDEAITAFKKMRREAKEAEKISYADDDPFIGLGILFVLGSLIRYGELPPELQ